MRELLPFITRYKIPISVGIAIVFVVTIAVFAIEEEKSIHVFPTQVKSDGWKNRDNALLQDLGGFAVVEDFTRNNASYVIFARDIPLEKEPSVLNPDAEEGSQDETSPGTTVEDQPTRNNEEEQTTDVTGNDTPIDDNSPLNDETSDQHNDVQEMVPESEQVDADIETSANQTDNETPAKSTVEEHSDPDGVSSSEEETVEEALTAPEQEPTVEPLEDITVYEYFYDRTKKLVGYPAHAQDIESTQMGDGAETQEAEASPEPGETEDATHLEEVAPEPKSTEEVNETTETSIEEEQTEVQSQTQTEPEDDSTSQPGDTDTAEGVEETTSDSDSDEESSSDGVQTVDGETPETITSEEITQEENTSTDVDDVRVCQILGTECHTLQFSGFDIGSVLSEESVTGHTLQASLGAVSENDRFVDDKVLVRYFYRNKWHLAGEITINDSVSNFENGGHFSFPLPDLTGWDALHNFKVEFEFIRQSNVRSEFYLDSVWVETTYKTNNDETPLFPDNVLEELVELEESRRGDLLRIGEETIEIPIVSEGASDLILRASTKKIESPGTGNVYLSVSNVGDKEKVFSLDFVMPNDEIEPEKLQQWMYNIPEEVEVDETGNLAQYCEAGWEETLEQSNEYMCVQSNSTLTCDEINTDNTNCIQHDVVIKKRNETVYKEGWKDIRVQTKENNKNESGLFGRIKKWFGFRKQPSEEDTNVYSGKEMYTVAPHQTLYFVAKMHYPQISEGGFAIKAVSDDEATLDIGWESNWRYRLPITYDRDTVGDILTMELTRKDAPHLFAHMTDWRVLFIREEGSHDSEQVVYSYTVINKDAVVLEINLDEAEIHSESLYLYYKGGTEKSVSMETVPFDTDIVYPEDTYNIDGPEEVYREGETDHRLIRGIDEKGNLNEKGTLLFAYRTNRTEKIAENFAVIPKKDEFSIRNVTLTHESEEEVENITYEQTVGNEWVLDTGMDERSFTPGKYTLEVEILEDDKVYIETQEFVWGVLTWNSTKTVYTPNEEVVMHMGALSDTGHTLCNADLTLSIRDPQGTDIAVPVETSGECNGNNVTDVPDYSARYTVGGVGTYDVLLELRDEIGEVVHAIEEQIVVQASTPYIVERTGPTRIYPVADYTMTLRVSATEDYVGTVVETVPEYFEVYDVSGARVRTSGDTKTLEWIIALAPGEETELTYTFDAPDWSPYIYKLGPAQLEDKFIELREWKIASDAVGNMMVFWDNATYIPAGWSCASCAPGDPFYQRFVIGSSTYNVTGGTATHNHTANGTVYGLGAGSTESKGDSVIEVSGHTHTYTPGISSENNLPLYRQLRVIQYDTAGEPASIPAGAIVMFDASVPTGWTRYSAQDGYFIYGENTPGTTGGTSTHNHTISGSTGASVGGSVGSRGGGTQSAAASDAHVHTVSGNSLYESNEPQRVEIILGQLNATSAPPNGIIAMWTDEVDTGWATLSSSTEVLENKFIKPSATYGGEGGTSTHSHSDVTSLTSSAVNDASSRTGSAGAGAHSHTVDVTGFSTDTHLPPYVSAVFGKRFSNDPIYTQNYYRFYVNENAEPPTDPWPAGATNLAENARITTADYTSKGDVVRIRMSLNVTNATATAYTDAFKLQYAEGATCGDGGNVWYDVAPISSSTAPWRGYNNSSVADGATTSSTTLSVSDVFETYEEENPSASTTNEIVPGEDGEWDWVVQHHEASPGTDYCFRMVESDGTTLSGYTNYPQLITDEAPGTPTLLTLFDNEKSSSTEPIFTFYTTDPEGDSIHYQIQIDTDNTFSGTPLVNKTSISSGGQFTNLDTPADKSPYNSGDTVQFTSQTTLSNNTTYWWRVRGQDTDGSGQWGAWSEMRSFTVDTGGSFSAWFQTTDEQFDTDTLVGVETSGGSDQVSLITGSSTGSITSTEIDFDWGTVGNAWGYLYFTDTETSSDIKYQIEFYDEGDSAWELIPDSALSGNSTGFDTTGVSLLGLDTTTYNRIRIKATLTNLGSSPVLQDWTISWGSRVLQPTLYKLFDNEKTGTTTPTFEFTTTDPQDDDLVYEISWTTDFTFLTGTTTRSSDADSGFQNISSSTDPSPFVSGDTIRFTVQSGDALTNGNTYWWRVRARDPGGGNAWSDWSEQWSFTVDTSVVASTWYQTTNEQFDKGGLFGITTLNNNAEVATSVSDVLIAYGEYNSQTPKYRFWDGSSWGNEQSALSVGASINWVVTRAHPTAEAYALATLGVDADVNVQIYEDGAWDNLQEMTTTISNTNARGVDIAYETLSGDLMVVYCDGDADPSYRVYNESTGWGTVGAINLASTNNCEWIRLASDPTSDEIIVLSLDAGGTQYEAQVWNGSTWGNSTTQGSMSSSNEGMAVMYEESGNQAIIVTSDGNAPKLRYNTWDGTTWGTSAQVNLGNDFEWGNLTRDDGTDAMAVCYIDDDNDIGAVLWTGSTWTGQTELDTVGNGDTDRPVDCEYETEGIRDGILMVNYSDDTNARYQSYNGATWSGEGSVSTITDSATIQNTRSDDGLILSVFFDDVNSQYDFSYWNGTSWSAVETLETEPSVTGSPFKEPFYMAPRNSAVEGTLYSPLIDFDDGTGPQWEEVSWSDSEPGNSTTTYQVQYYDTNSSSWELIPDGDLPGNSIGTGTSPININSLDTGTYNEIRIVGNFECDASGNCPVLNDWTVEWSEGFTVSGIAREFDQVTTVTSGTVAIAVNGALQIGKTGTISGGSWSISNVTAFEDDILTVWIDNALESDEAIAVTQYDGTGGVSGVNLYERHLTIGSDDNPTISNVQLSSFDNSVSGDEDIFFDVDTNNDLYVCESGQPSCGSEQLFIRDGSTFTPATSTLEFIYTHDIDIEGSLIASSNSFDVSGSWTNTGIFSADSSTVIMSATSTTETIDSTGATTSAFHDIAFGSGVSNATWTLASLLDVNDTLTLSSGTLAPGAGYEITIGGDLLIGSTGNFLKSTGTTTFDGTGSNTWNDLSTPLQDVGLIVVDGTSKTITQTTDTLATTLIVGSDDTFAQGGFTLELGGSFENSGTFVPVSGEVLMSATGAGNTIDIGNSSFYDLTFNGVGGNWTFPGGDNSVENDMTISNGIVTMPTGTTTLDGSLFVTGGQFVHNNGLVYFTANTSETITASTSPFFDMKFAGTGDWTMTDTNATSSNNVTLNNGSVVFSTGTFAIGGSLLGSGGTFTHSNGTVRFYSGNPETISTNSSDFHNVLVDGVGGEFNMTDTDLSILGDIDLVYGSTTFPTGTLTLEGSLSATGGDFLHNSGTVLFSTSSIGHTVRVSGSDFYNVTFDDVLGGWTLLDSATSANDWTLENANVFVAPNGGTVEVQGDFTNTVGGSATTWANSTLYLNSGASTTVNTKTSGSDFYGTLQIGVNTDIKMWNSSSSIYTVDSSGSLYSQDHGGSDGDLYIWGSYERTGGSEYWSYGTDFDGVDLTGSERPVSVQFANGSHASITDATVEISGVSNASTSINNQGSGNYGVSVSSSTLDANYYSFNNMNAQGLTLLGSTTVTELGYAEYILAVNGGTLLTVSSTTLDTNPTLQIDNTRFATTSAITGYNVTVTGTPTSYWTYRDHTGNLDGEQFDNDPGGNPGEIRWDDSSFVITVEGNVYTGEGSGVPSYCNGSTQVVSLKIDGAGNYLATCAAGTGAYSIPNVTFSGDVVLTAYLTGAIPEAATVSKSPNTDVTDFDLYEHRVIVRHEGTEPLTIADMSVFDDYDDTDMPFVATTSPDELFVERENKLYIWPNMEFAPGGDVTLESGGSGAAYDGSIHLADFATLTATGSEEFSIGGSWSAATSSTFTRALSTVYFTATTSGKTIAPASDFYDVEFTGSGGEWSIASSTTVIGAFTLSNGTVNGTADVTVYDGPVIGNGTFAMSGGTVTLLHGNSFGGNSSWTFNNLTFATSVATTTTKTGSGDVTINSVLTIGPNHTLEAGSVEWFLSGSGDVFVVNGAFVPQTSTTTYNSISDNTVTGVDYYDLQFAPPSGSPTYTIETSNFDVNRDMYIGNGNAVTLQANTNDPLIDVHGDVLIATNATYEAASDNDLFIGGSYNNNGTFTANGGGVIFNSSDTGETITSGSSPFHHVYFLHDSGGWTLLEDTTATGNFSISSSSNWTLTSGRTLEVQGMFNNVVGGGATEWTGSTLYLNSGTNYSINTSTHAGDTYSTLQVGANTDVRMWYSTSSVYTVDGTGSLYSQDHNNVSGDLYIFGDYVRSAGSDYWSYATDFDGADIAGSERIVDVYIANNGNVTLTGGTLEIQGGATATTTITNQGTGTYGFDISGGTIDAQYYAFRNLDATGLNITNTPSVTSLSNGDFELAVNGGSLITVAGSAITANPLKIMYENTFSTSTGATTGNNVTATGVTGSSWRFTSHTGGFSGEFYDQDPAGDPGYIIWDDSAGQITLSGNVYGTNETSVSGVCDGSTPVVTFRINGGTASTTACNAGTGAYSFSGIVYNTGDVFTVYLDTNGGAKATNVTVDPITNINDMHLYEDRLVVRHEGVDPISIDDLDAYDADQDADILFDADTGSPGTLTLDSGSKLIVWSGKSLAPDGNLSLTSLGAGSSYDGDLELKDNANFIAVGTESHTVGGSFLSGTGAGLTPANSTFTFTSTSSGETIDTNTSAFANIIFNGIGGTWTFLEGNATTTGDVTNTNGDVTLATSTFAVGGSFVNNDTFTGTTTHLKFTGDGTESVTFGGYDVGAISFIGSGNYSMNDTNATSTESFYIGDGTVVLPSGTLSVRTSFINDAGAGAFTHGAGTLNLYGDEAAQSLTYGTTSLASLTISGSGSWIITDTDATSTGSVFIENGGLTAPAYSYAIGGSLDSDAVFNANAGTLYFFATTTGHTVDANGALLGSVIFDGSGGGWEVTTSATSTGDWRLKTGASFTMATGTVLEVGGVFENTIGGTATDWTNSTLYLNASGTTFAINSKTDTGDAYAFMTLGDNTHVSMWNSSVSTTTATSTSSLYSQDNDNQDGDLYIYGDYTSTSTDQYWSYATDFDGTALGGSSRPVDVRIASSSNVVLSGGTLEIIGSSGSTSTIAVIQTGAYSFTVSGGTFEAEYFSISGTDADGVHFENAPAITTLGNGAFVLTANSGSMITVSSSTINNNPSRTFSGNYFSTSSGITAGYNVSLNGTTNNIWQFTNHEGNYDGEEYDNDGATACGQIRWEDSSCLEVSQTHYRFRSDNGGEGAPASEWFDTDWDKRKLIKIYNTNGPQVTNYAFKVDIPYDSDMQADFDDLRFTDDSGTTPLSYWFEDVQTSATVTAWVKIPTLSANDVTRIFVYYDNALVAGAESGTSTFTFFDDFEDNDIDEYSGSVQDLSYFATNGSFNWEGSYGLSASGGNTDKQTNGGIYRTGTSFSQGSTIRFFQKITASTDDEPCALFAVQGSGQNYGVCLDQYPNDVVVISEDVTSNSDDGSATELATTSVTWGTGWYEVEIDWLLDNSIDVTVYDDSGSVFATTSTSDGTYTSGGMGFAFWYQSEGWDFYSVRPYIENEPTYAISAEQIDGGASWKTAQDTPLVGQSPNENFRVRFTVENTGTQITGQTWRLQYAPKSAYGACEGVPSVDYDDVPNAAGCGVNAVCMTASGNITDQEVTTEHIDTSLDGLFINGHMVESPSNQTNAMTLEQNDYTEVEYSIEFTDFATESNYCLRTTNGGVEVDTYLRIAEASVRFAPVVSNWSLNDGFHIALTEGQTTLIYATGTISDQNGWDDILFATTTIYRSGVSESCPSDENNCYRLTSLDCPMTQTGPNSVEVECSADIQFFAEPTDSGTYSAEHWEAYIYTIDTTGNVATATSHLFQSRTVDMLTLWALDVTSGDIEYGTLGVAEDTGGVNATTSLQNTGNDNIDVELEGTNMTASGSSIPVANQLYSTSTFTYSSCIICSALSGAATPFEVDLVKPTDTTPVTDDLYWGLYVPTGTGGQTHYGQNTFYATGD